MNNRRAFTLIEIVVVIAIIFLLLGISIPVIGRAREAGRRITCLSNLKNLQLGWDTYTQSNDDKIVCGDATWGPNVKTGEVFDCNGLKSQAPCWTGRCSDVGNAIDYDINTTPQMQVQAIKAGALYAYVGSEKSYRCPNGFPEFRRTYSIVESMNNYIEMPNVINPPVDMNEQQKDEEHQKTAHKVTNKQPRRVFTQHYTKMAQGHSTSGSGGGGGGCGSGDAVPNTDNDPNFIKCSDKWNKMIVSKLYIKNPSSRMIFADEGMPTDFFSVSFYDEVWDSVTCRHKAGNTFSFADGHVEYWKWFGPDTIKYGLSIKPENLWSVFRRPTTNGGFKDLHNVQMAVWGGITYIPTPTE
jgi:prepilin-type N-terminal cleavage/methylation domain-containing protein/prepilin-type processing-associated H-X9-DG protein